MGDLVQLIYTSTPFGYDSADLNGILMDARRCNRRDAITGALVCRHDIYMQFLEGPAESIAATYDRISRDDRHVEVVLRYKNTSLTRLFGGWSMMHDPAQSLIWSIEDVANRVLEGVSEDAFITAFRDIATPD